MIVAATSAVGMFGAKYNTDALGLKNIHVHPYHWTAAGSTIVPVLRDQNNVIHIALVHNSRRDRDKKVYRLPEGYMHPKGCPEYPNALPTLFQSNDEAEIKIAFQGVNHTEAYRLHKPILAEEPDKDLVAISLRELQEEISITLDRDHITFLGQREEEGKIHSIANYFLADLNYSG